jgi:myosin heavy subunit
MDCLDVSSEDQDTIFKILSAVLHIGNIQFKPKGSEAVEVADQQGRFCKIKDL